MWWWIPNNPILSSCLVEVVYVKLHPRVGHGGLPHLHGVIAGDPSSPQPPPSSILDEVVLGFVDVSKWPKVGYQGLPYPYNHFFCPQVGHRFERFPITTLVEVGSSHRDLLTGWPTIFRPLDWVNHKKLFRSYDRFYKVGSLVNHLCEGGVRSLGTLPSLMEVFSPYNHPFLFLLFFVFYYFFLGDMLLVW